MLRYSKVFENIRKIQKQIEAGEMVSPAHREYYERGVKTFGKYVEFKSKK